MQAIFLWKLMWMCALFYFGELYFYRSILKQIDQKKYPKACNTIKIRKPKNLLLECFISFSRFLQPCFFRTSFYQPSYQNYYCQRIYSQMHFILTNLLNLLATKKHEKCYKFPLFQTLYKDLFCSYKPTKSEQKHK